MDDWVYQDLQVARFFGVPPDEPGNWYNSDFYDCYEYLLVVSEVDRRTLRKGQQD